MLIKHKKDIPNNNKILNQINNNQQQEEDVYWEPEV